MKITRAGAGAVVVDGLATRVAIIGAEATDRLVVQGLAGNDTLIGGRGDDILIQD